MANGLRAWFFDPPLRSKMRRAAEADKSHGVLSSLSDIAALQERLDRYYQANLRSEMSYEEWASCENRGREVIPQRLTLLDDAANAVREYDRALDDIHGAEKPVLTGALPVMAATVGGAITGGAAVPGLLGSMPSVFLNASKFSEKKRQMIERSERLRRADFLARIYALREAGGTIVGHRCWCEPNCEEGFAMPVFWSLADRGPGYRAS